MIQRSVVIRHFQDQMLTLNQSEENHARTYGTCLKRKGKKKREKRAHHWENKTEEALKKPFLLYGISCFVTSFKLFSNLSFYACVYGGWEERKRERAGQDGRGKREERLPPFPSSHRPPRAFYFFRLLLFLLVYPAGAYAEESERLV